MVHMRTFHLQLKVNCKRECPLLMYRLFLKIKHLPLLSILPLVKLIYIFTTFNHLPLRLVLSTHSHLDASEYVGAELITNEICVSKRNFLKNACPENFINKCFKKFTDKIHVLKEATLTVEKKPYVLFLPYLGLISLLARTKLKKPFINIPHCCNLQVVFIRQQLSFLVSFISFSVDYAVSRVMVNVWDNWILELVNMLVYYHLQIGTLHDTIAPIRQGYLVYY